MNITRKSQKYISNIFSGFLSNFYKRRKKENVKHVTP